MTNHFVLIKAKGLTEYAIKVNSEDGNEPVYISESGYKFRPDRERYGFGAVITLEEDIREEAKALETFADGLPVRIKTGKPTRFTIHEVLDTKDCPEHLLTTLRDDYLDRKEKNKKTYDAILFIQNETKKLNSALESQKDSIRENCSGNISFVNEAIKKESTLLKQMDFLTEFVNCLPKDFYQIVFPRVPEQLNDNECNTPIYEIGDGKIKIQRAIYLYEYPEDSSLQKALDECRTKCSSAATNHPGFKDEIFRDTVPIEETIEVPDESPDCDYTYTPFNPYEEPPTHKETVTVGEQCIGILYRQRIEIPYEGRLTKEYAKELADKFTNEILALTPSLENNSGDEIED